MLDLAVVFKALLKVGARPALRRAQRQVGVLRTLKSLGISPVAPPDDFLTIYAYALVQHLWGQPPFIVRFFEADQMRMAFEVSFNSGDWTLWRREADQWMASEGQGPSTDWIDYDPRAQLDAFAATFFLLLDKARKPTEVRRDQRLDELLVLIREGGVEASDMAVSLQTMISLQQDIAELLDERLPQRAEAGEFHSQVFDWLRAVGNRVERIDDLDGEIVTATIEVPVRRGRYERVLVRSVHREVGAEDVFILEGEAQEQRVDEAWLVASRRVSQGARAATEEGRVACYTFDELIDQDADFEPYLNWLDAEVERRGIDQRYVDLAGSKDEFNRIGQRLGESVFDSGNGWIDGYVDTWLDDSSKGHLSLLGEFGAGKSWFCLHYAWMLAQRYRDAQRRGITRPRLPIVIPLRDYAKAVHVESLFSEFFFRKHELNLPGYSAFEQLNRMGRLFLIFDGFDEMAARVDRQAMVNNFWELARAVVPGAKVLLTCRTEHFPAARDGRALLSAELRASTSDLSGEAPQFEMMHMLPWDDAQVHRVLTAMTDLETVSSIESDPELMDLLKRPVMAELVLDALPDVKSGARVDTTRVFLYAVRRKMSRDIKNERTFTSMSEKMFFLCELSWEMLSRDEMKLNYRLMPDRIREYFGGVVATERDLDHWHYDMMGQTMLIRNSEGDYFPAHRSLLEFFVAYKIVAELGLLADEYLETLNEGRDPASSCAPSWDSLFAPSNVEERRSFVARLTPVDIEQLGKTLGSGLLTRTTIAMMVAMLETIADESIARLIDIIQATSPESHRNVAILGGNCATLAVNIRADALSGVDLSGTSVVDAMFDMGLGGAFLGKTNFNNSNCSGSDFERATLVGASFRGADLTGAENIGYNDASVRWMEASASSGGRVLLLTNDGNLSSFDLEDGVRKDVCWLGRELFEMETSPGGRFVIAAGPGVTVVEVETGHVVFSSRDHGGGVFVCEQGETEAVELWVRGPHLSNLQMERVSLETGLLPVPPVEFEDEVAAGFWSADVGATAFLLSGPRLVHATLRDGVPHLDEALTLDLMPLDGVSPDDANISYMHGVISYRWTRVQENGMQTRIAVLDGRGSHVSTIDYATSLDALGQSYHSKADRAFRLGDIFITLDPDGVRAHSDAGIVWMEDASIVEIQKSPNPNEILFSDRYGNIGLLTISSMDRRYLKVQGEVVGDADFSNARGLTSEQRRVFAAMGGRA